MKKYLSAYTPSLGELWLIMLALLCVGGSIASAIVTFGIKSIMEVDLIQLSLLLYPLLFTFVIPFVWIRAKQSYREKTLMGVPIPQEAPPSFGSIPAWVFFALLLILTPAASIAIEPLSMWIKMPDFFKELFGGVSNNGWVSIFSLVIMAPLLEEWLCRGVALNGLLKSGYSPAAAIVWSAFMFGVIHMNPWQAIPAFTLGLLFGWVYWRTKSLWSVIFMHAINNGSSVALTWLLPNLSEDASALDLVGGQWYPWVLSGAVIVVVSIIFLFHKKLRPATPLFSRASQ